MKNGLKYALLSFGVLLCLSYAGYSYEEGRNLDNEKICKGIEINITDSQHRTLITEKEISDFLNAKQMIPTGKFYSKIKTKKIEDAVEKHLMVRRAECYKMPNGKLRIDIVQRSPILKVMCDGNYYVDDQRKIIPVSSNFTAYVPVASGYVDKKTASGKLYDFAMYLSKDSFWNNQIDQIYITDSMKVYLVPRVGDHTIVMGNFDRYEKKLEKLKKLYLYGLNKTGWNQYKTIDVQYKDQVVCTKR